MVFKNKCFFFKFAGRTSEIARWRRSPRIRVVLPEWVTTGRKQPVTVTDEVKINPPDELDGPQGSPIQTSASPGLPETGVEVLIWYFLNA